MAINKDERLPNARPNSFSERYVTDLLFGRTIVCTRRSDSFTSFSKRALESKQCWEP